MKNKHVVKKLKVLRNIHVEMIDPAKGVNFNCGLASNYSQLINRIADLLKTSKKALDGLHVSEETYITDPEYNIADVIGIVIKILPYSEMKFIDEVLRLLDQKDKIDSFPEQV